MTRAFLFERGSNVGHLALSGTASARALNQGHEHPEGAVLCGYPAEEWTAVCVEPVSHHKGGVACRACMNLEKPQ